MFSPNSRYYTLTAYSIRDIRGRQVKVVPVPEPPVQGTRGFHQRKRGQRLDHLADRYLDDATAFWKIAEANDALWPDAIAEKNQLTIPFSD